MSMSQYRGLFVSESRRHLEVFNDLIVQIENHTNSQNAINELFRHAHSLKGMAATMQFHRISELAHKMEDLLSRVRNNEFSLTPDTADILLEGSDLLAKMVTLIEADQDNAMPDTAELVKRLEKFIPATTAPVMPVDPVTTQPEIPLPHQFRQSDSFKTVRIRTDTLDHLVNITGELITTRHRLADQCSSGSGAGIEEPLGQLSVLLRELRDEVFLARMLPVSLITERFPRLVRDLARAQNKDVVLTIEGDNIELDRGILEDITEPLLHILRNSVDHGIEPPAERALLGKPAAGMITISVGREKDHATITVCDDGRGMDPVFLAELAVKRGFISSEQAAALTPQEAFMLICMPGFSTAQIVSDISGRGVGMDAVKSAAHTLGGALAIESEFGKGSRFQLRLPLSVSIIHALLVECADLTVALPVNAVERTLEIAPSDIFDEDGRKFCQLDNIKIPLRTLHTQLMQPAPALGSPHVPIIVSRLNGASVGFICDRIAGQQEIFVKPLGRPFSHLKNASGGAILGSGHIVFVMDLSTFS